MKKLNIIILLSTLILISFSVTSNAQVNILINSSEYPKNRKIANVAVVIYSFKDAKFEEFKQSLENIQKSNQDKINFTFFDSQNNVSIENEILSSLLISNFDLLLITLVNPTEEIVKDTVFRFRQTQIPLILYSVPKQTASKIRNKNDKIVFVIPDLDQAGAIEGKIIANLWNRDKTHMDTI